MSVFCHIIFFTTLNISLWVKCLSWLSMDFHHVIAQNISFAIHEIVLRNFVEDEHQLNLNFYTKAAGEERLIYFGDIVDQTLSLINARVGVTIGLDQEIPPNHLRHYAVLLVDSLESLLFLHTQLSQYHLTIRGYYIIVLHTFASQYFDQLSNITVFNANQGIFNAVVLIYALHNQILLFTYFPFNEFHCKGVAPVICNRFIDSQWQNDDFFPDKFANLNGCALTVATWEDMPYFGIVRNGDRNTGRPIELIGIEGKLLEYLADKLNFTISFRWLDEDEIGQTLDSEGAVFHKLFKAGTDFVLGAFRYKPTQLTDAYAPTVAYYFSSYQFIVNSNLEPYSPFTKLLFPFVYEIWCILLLIFVSVVLVLLFTRCFHPPARVFIIGRRNQTPFYNMFVVALGGPISTEAVPGRNFARFLLCLWLATTFVLRTCYQAFMYHFIRTNITVPAPNTISEILSKEYVLAMTKTVYCALDYLPGLQSSAVILNDSEVNSFGMLVESDKKWAILTAYEYFGYYRTKNIRTDGFYVVHEQVFTQQLSIYMRKNSPLLAHFNKHISDYINVGLMQKWSQAYVDSRFATHESIENLEELPQKMTPRNIYGAFLILLAGYSVSLLIFLTEVIFNIVARFIRKCKRARKRQAVIRREMRYTNREHLRAVRSEFF